MSAAWKANLDDCPARFDGEPASFFGGWLIHKDGRPCPDEIARPNAARGWREREQQQRMETHRGN